MWVRPYMHKAIKYFNTINIANSTLGDKKPAQWIKIETDVLLFFPYFMLGLKSRYNIKIYFSCYCIYLNTYIYIK